MLFHIDNCSGRQRHIRRLYANYKEFLDSSFYYTAVNLTLKISGAAVGVRFIFSVSRLIFSLHYVSIHTPLASTTLHSLLG